METQHRILDVTDYALGLSYSLTQETTTNHPIACKSYCVSTHSAFLFQFKLNDCTVFSSALLSNHILMFLVLVGAAVTN